MIRSIYIVIHSINLDKSRFDLIQLHNQCVEANFTKKIMENLPESFYKFVGIYGKSMTNLWKNERNG